MFIRNKRVYTNWAQIIQCFRVIASYITQILGLDPSSDCVELRVSCIPRCSTDISTASVLTFLVTASKKKKGPIKQHGQI